MDILDKINQRINSLESASINEGQMPLSNKFFKTPDEVGAVLTKAAGNVTKKWKKIEKKILKAIWEHTEDDKVKVPKLSCNFSTGGDDGMVGLEVWVSMDYSTCVKNKKDWNDRELMSVLEDLGSSEEFRVDRDGTGNGSTALIITYDII